MTASRKKFPFIVALAAHFLAGCQHSHDGRPPSPLTIQYTLHADPAADAKAALRSGKIKFIGITEFGQWIPGAQDHPELTKRYGVQYIEGASDTAPKELEDAASEYAEIYNMILVRELRYRKP